jgi:hypothetical protein
LLDVLIDRGVLLDVGVTRGNVGLGLVIVVVGNKVLDSVLRKEFAEFAVQLGRQRLVMGQDERRALDPVTPSSV